MRNSPLFGSWLPWRRSRFASVLWICGRRRPRRSRMPSARRARATTAPIAPACRQAVRPRCNACRRTSQACRRPVSRPSRPQPEARRRGCEGGGSDARPRRRQPPRRRRPTSSRAGRSNPRGHRPQAWRGNRPDAPGMRRRLQGALRWRPHHRRRRSELPGVACLFPVGVLQGRAGQARAEILAGGANSASVRTALRSGPAR